MFRISEARNFRLVEMLSSEVLKLQNSGTILTNTKILGLQNFKINKTEHAVHSYDAG